jgi:hypothetical protein
MNPEPRKPEPGTIWRHWKGNSYRVHQTVVNVSHLNGELVVVYHDLAAPNRVFVRDLYEWEQVVGNPPEPRFVQLPAEMEALSGRPMSLDPADTELVRLSVASIIAAQADIRRISLELASASTLLGKILDREAAP